MNSQGSPYGKGSCFSNKLNIVDINYSYFCLEFTQKKTLEQLNITKFILNLFANPYHPFWVFPW